MFRKIVVAALMCCGLPSVTLAENEDALYGAPVPEGAVFLRALAPLDPQFEIFGQRLEATALASGAFASGAFVAIAPDVLPSVPPGAHYSVHLSTGGDLIATQEPDREDPTKVALTLLNVDAPWAELRVAGGGPVVIAKTPANDAKARGVNPVQVTLEVVTDTTTTAFDVTLRRKQNLTFVARAGQPPEMIIDTYGPVYGSDYEARDQ